MKKENLTNNVIDSCSCDKNDDNVSENNNSRSNGNSIVDINNKSKRSLHLQHIEQDSAEYPSRLKKYPHMPKELYWMGNLPQDNIPTVAIVGARKCSTYGRIQAFEFAKAFSKAGVQVISGLAYGIDSEAHKGALEGKAPTFAVLGCGAEMCYPASNRGLYQRILRQNGGILSEYPPGTPALPHHFPVRNRIISALADIVLVVEAKNQSGSLVTANYALEQGKSVYAMPGSINDELSIGCHKLIYDGAGIAYCPEVILEELGICNVSGSTVDKELTVNLEETEKIVYEKLSLKPMSMDDLLEKTGISVGELHKALMKLQLNGYARETGAHKYIRDEKYWHP